MAHVQALESGVQGFANAVKRFAIKDKAFAEELAFIHNIRSEINPKSLKPLTRDKFDSAGRMTEKARQQLAFEIQELGLPKTATWEDILSAVRNTKQRLAEKCEELSVELKMPEFNKTKECPNLKMLGKL